MDTPTNLKSFSSIGERIKKIRQERGLTQEALAGPEFTKGYVSALERGAVRPSLKALDVFARRLDVPLSDFVSADQSVKVTPDLAALEEDLHYQANYAKMLIRANQVDEALDLLAELARGIESYRDKLAARTLYLIPFLRGRAYLQRMDPNRARPELEAALEYARDDEEATARVRNLLGVIFFEKEQPQLALDHHLNCLHAVQRGTVKDLNLRVSIYRNLANDYWALNDLPQAIGVYEEALTVLEDVNDLERQAHLFWGLAMAYRKAGDWTLAKLYGTRALYIFEAADSRGEAASMCMHLSEILLDEKRYADAEQFLQRASDFLAGTGSLGLLSSLYRDYADLARRQARLAQASEYAEQSIQWAKALLQKAESENPDAGIGAEKTAPDRVWLDMSRTYAEALHVAALIEEAQGNTDAADRLFQEALGRLHQTGLEETIRFLAFGYADVLNARGDYKQAMEYYRSAAQTHSRQMRSGS